MPYTPIFTKPYADGYKNRPDKSTPVTAEIKNKETETLLAIEAYLEALQIPEKLSELTNDEGFIKNTVSNLANYYLKSETYTQEEVKALIAAAVSSVAGKLNMEVVDSLPAEGISTTTFYLLPKETAEEKNVYDEYINTDGTTSGWEIIGAVSTSVDLSEYYKKTEVEALLAEKVSTSDLVASSFSGTKAIIGNQVSSGGGGSALHVYSTEEKVVGTWIDGRKIYEKTWQIDNTTATNNWDVTNADFENIAFVTSACLYDADSDSTRYVAVSAMKLSSTSIRFYTGDSWASIDAYTIQYVKTTDTATT